MQHKEQIAEALTEAKQQSYAKHKEHIEEMMSGMRVMLDQIRPLQNTSRPSGTKNVAFNLMKIACLLQCIVMCY